VLARAVPILEWFEKLVHPRLATPANLTKRLVGVVVMLLTIRLLISPFPMSNIPPSLLIAVISLAYVEQDGLLLLGAVLASCILLRIELHSRLATETWSRLDRCCPVKIGSAASCGVQSRRESFRLAFI
jgi:hypothetical protein